MPELNLNDIKGTAAPSLEAWSLAAAIAAFDGLDGSLHDAFVAGLEAATESVDSGAALDLLERWIAFRP